VLHVDGGILTTNHMLQTKTLSKSYSDELALKNLNFSVEPSEIFCLLGQNGAGKIATINIIWSLIKSTSGEALVDGGQSNLIPSNSDNFQQTETNGVTISLPADSLINIENLFSGSRNTSSYNFYTDL